MTDAAVNGRSGEIAQEAVDGEGDGAPRKSLG
jgi:hypothetical protein